MMPNVRLPMMELAIQTVLENSLLVLQLTPRLQHERNGLGWPKGNCEEGDAYGDEFAEAVMQV